MPGMCVAAFEISSVAKFYRKAAYRSYFSYYMQSTDCQEHLTHCPLCILRRFLLCLVFIPGVLSQQASSPQLNMQRVLGERKSMYNLTSYSPRQDWTMWKRWARVLMCSLHQTPSHAHSSKEWRQWVFLPLLGAILQDAKDFLCDAEHPSESWVWPHTSSYCVQAFLQWQIVYQLVFLSNILLCWAESSFI